MTRYDAFLSYRRVEPDRTFARALLRQLEDAGYKIAIDERDFAANENWLDEMVRCMEESLFTLAVISPRYFQRGAALHESLFQTMMDVDSRHEGKRRLIPLIMEEAELPVWLHSLTSVDFTARDPLILPLEKLKASLGPPPGARSPSQPPLIHIAASTVPPVQSLAPFKLVHTQVTATGVLDWDLSPLAPYDDFLDVTGSTRERRRVTIVASFPPTDYLKGPNKRFTAVAAICCLEPERVGSDLLQASAKSGVDLVDPKEPVTHPGDLERLFSAISSALGGTFVVAVAVPITLLLASRSKPERSFHVLSSMFLAPLVDLHNKLFMEEIHIKLFPVGDCTPKLKALAWTVLVGGLPRRKQKTKSTVEIVGANQGLRAVSMAAHYVAWAVEQFYNWAPGRSRDPDKWLAYLARRL